MQYSTANAVQFTAASGGSGHSEFKRSQNFGPSLIVPTPRSDYWTSDLYFKCFYVLFKSVLIYGAETWSLYEDDRRRIDAAEMDALTLRRLMSFIYGAPILDVSRSHTTTQHSR